METQPAYSYKRLLELRIRDWVTRHDQLTVEERKDDNHLQYILTILQVELETRIGAYLYERGEDPRSNQWKKATELLNKELAPFLERVNLDDLRAWNSRYIRECSRYHSELGREPVSQGLDDPAVHYALQCIGNVHSNGHGDSQALVTQFQAFLDACDGDKDLSQQHCLDWRGYLLLRALRLVAKHRPELVAAQ